MPHTEVMLMSIGHPDLSSLVVPPGVMAMSESLPLPRAISGSEVLLQLGSVLMTVTQVITKGHVSCSLKPC